MTDLYKPAGLKVVPYDSSEMHLSEELILIWRPGTLDLVRITIRIFILVNKEDLYKCGNRIRNREKNETLVKTN